MTPVCLVLRAAEGSVCLLADEVGDVVQVADDTFEPAPQTLPPRLRSMICGVHKLKHQLMHVLDTDRTCELQPASAGRSEP
jgi:purine-binding chemotaxis protein CheW